MTLMEEFKAHGPMEAATGPEAKKALETPQTACCGFDPSASPPQAKSEYAKGLKAA